MTRRAVSVLVTPDLDSSQALLVKRNPRLKFFGGYLAFPGGSLESEDATAPVRTAKDGGFGVFVAAAARELLEEIGIWAGRGGRPPEAGQLETYRTRLLQGDIGVTDILRQHDQFLDAADFEPICRITTPPSSPIRFDTWFLRYCLGQRQPVIWPGELEEGSFFSARQALIEWTRGDLLIVPPVLMLLRELQGKSCRTFLPSVRDLTDSYARGKLHHVTFSPGILVAPLRTRPLPPATHTNTWLVGHERIYIVDPGTHDPDEQEKLWELVDELRDNGRTLAGILLSHHHVDHVGAVAECQRRYGLSLLAHRQTVERLPDLHFSEVLEDGERIELGTAPDGTPDWTLQAFHLPGHAVGHLVFKESRYLSVLAGDMVSTLSSILIDPDEGDLIEYMSSLQRLHSLAEGFLYPSHGPPARHGRVAVERAIRHRQEREQKLIRCLEGGPQPLPELLGSVYDDVPAHLLNLARRSLLSGLLKLEREGTVEQEDGLYRLIVQNWAE